MIADMGQVMRMHEFASETDARISAAVRALASGRGVQPEEVAFSIGMPKGTIYNKLKGRSPWKASEVTQLASYFQIRIGDLYDGLGGRVGPQPQGPLAQSVELRTFNPLSGLEENAKILPFRAKPIPQDMTFVTAS